MEDPFKRAMNRIKAMLEKERNRPVFVMPESSKQIQAVQKQKINNLKVNK